MIAFPIIQNLNAVLQIAYQLLFKVSTISCLSNETTPLNCERVTRKCIFHGRRIHVLVSLNPTSVSFPKTGLLSNLDKYRMRRLFLCVAVMYLITSKYLYAFRVRLKPFELKEKNLNGKQQKTFFHCKSVTFLLVTFLLVLVVLKCFICVFCTLNRNQKRIFVVY